MRYVLILLVLAFSSCKKCADCTRNWTFQEYKKNNSGNGYYKYGQPFYGTKETFDVCGSDNIGNEEAVKKSSTPTTNGGYIEGTGTCNCIAK